MVLNTIVNRGNIAKDKIIVMENIDKSETLI